MPQKYVNHVFEDFLVFHESLLAKDRSYSECAERKKCQELPAVLVVKLHLYQVYIIKNY